VPRRLAHDPDLDVDSYATEIATVFHLATRTDTRDHLLSQVGSSGWDPQEREDAPRG
jgi:hypothetical protein